MRATDPSQLGGYVCKKHGPDPNPVVYTRSNGYIHRRCRQCYRAIQRPLNRAWLKKNRVSIRAEVLAAYGGKCECCSESNPGFLSIDHVNNDGKQHREELRGIGSAIYGWLKDQGCPQDGRFRLLCLNCNIGRARNGGICPHVELKS
jgi:hypothetical protein